MLRLRFYFEVVDVLFVSNTSEQQAVHDLVPFEKSVTPSNTTTTESGFALLHCRMEPQLCVSRPGKSSGSDALQSKALCHSARSASPPVCSFSSSTHSEMNMTRRWRVGWGGWGGCQDSQVLNVCSLRQIPPCRSALKPLLPSGRIDP